MKKTKLLTSLVAFVLVLGLGACGGSEEEETPSEGDSTSSEPSGSGEATLPVLGEVATGTYFLGFNMDNVDYYFDGTVYNTNYAGVTSEIGLAVPVTVAALESGYSLSFEEEGETVYLNLTESGTYRNLKWGSEVYAWSYDTTYSVFVALDSEEQYYFIGTYGTYKDLTLSSYGYLTGDLETSNAQYPAKLYTIPEDWEPTTGRDDEGLKSVEIEGATLLGTYDFSKSELTGVTAAFGATNSETGEATGPTKEEVLKIFADAYVAGAAETSPLADVSYNNFAFKGAGGGSTNSGLQLSEACLKLGNSSNNGELTLTYEGYTLSNVVVTAAGWNNTETNLTINDAAQTLTQAANGLSYVDEVETYTYELSDATELKLSGSARVLIFGIAIYGEEALGEPETETLYTSDLEDIKFEVNDTDDYIYGKTWTGLTSCDVTFDTGDFTNTRWSTSYIRLYENATITFTPKNGHKLVGLSVTWANGTFSKAISIVDDAATVVNSDTGAVISEIVDGTATLTVKNAGGSNEQLYFGNTVIYYY